MKASNYYALRCAVVEAFWDAVAGEKLTLVVLSVVLSRLARYEPTALRRFGPELKRMQEISEKPGCWRGLDASEKARMREDVRLALEKGAV